MSHIQERARAAIELIDSMTEEEFLLSAREAGAIVEKSGSKVHWNERAWLNDRDSHFTGSMVCFDGENVINQGKLLDRYTFVEIASCHTKVRIHADANSSMEAFIEKLRVMRSELDGFLYHLDDRENKAKNNKWG